MNTHQCCWDVKSANYGSSNRTKHSALSRNLDIKIGTTPIEHALISGGTAIPNLAPIPGKLGILYVSKQEEY